ncbi:hypothetical protein ACSDR0_14565 [Streptosporangium sp. G11]|uniref:hypothetical protein n=1 Tax=Streptosporangium sp. G11 TaxID=3436926 RepID=UPI003EBBD929
MISLVVTIAIGVAQVYLAWLQLRHSRNQATPQRTGPAENSPPPSPSRATIVEPAPSPGPAQPPHDAPAEPPPAAPHQHRAPESHPIPDPQVGDPQAEEARPSSPPDTPVANYARDIIPVLPYIAPWVGGLMILSALGWIFGYDDLAKDYTTPMGRMQLSVSLWFAVVALLISSASTGFTAYTWSREKSISDDNEERFNLYVVIAVLGPPIAVWLVIARRAVMF